MGLANFFKIYLTSAVYHLNIGEYCYGHLQVNNLIEDTGINSPYIFNYSYVGYG